MDPTTKRAAPCGLAPGWLMTWCKENVATLPRNNKREVLCPVSWPEFIKYGPNPTLRLTNSSTLGTMDPKQYYLANTRVIFWAPHIFWPLHGIVKCPHCKSADNVKKKGWANKLRRVMGLGFTFYLYGYRYYCKDCPGNMWATLIST